MVIGMADGTEKGEAIRIMEETEGGGGTRETHREVACPHSDGCTHALRNVSLSIDADGCVLCSV